MLSQRFESAYAYVYACRLSHTFLHRWDHLWTEARDEVLAFKEEVNQQRRCHCAHVVLGVFANIMFLICVRRVVGVGVWADFDGRRYFSTAYVFCEEMVCRECL